MKGLTQKQKNIFTYVNNYINEQGYPPTIREVSEVFEITGKGAYDHLKALDRKGYIRCHKHRSRAIEILKPVDGMPKLSSGILNIPLLGQVAAGVPLVAEENIEEYISLPRSIVRDSSSSGRGLFALRVTGDSMKDAGIVDGDIAIIRKQETAIDGDIVVALLDDEATLKYFYRESRSKIRLAPANSAYKPIITRDLLILGKLVGVYRSVA